MKLLLLLLALPMIGFGQNVNIPDAIFKAYLVTNTAINTNGDNEIQVSEASAFNDTINCSYMNISNLTGIQAFTALTSLFCNNNQLTSLDVSQNTALTSLFCNYNQLTSLDVRNGNNNNFLAFFAFGNPNLYCINVDDDAFSTFNWILSNYFVFDSDQYFSNNCSGAGISDINESNTLMLYPNPTNGDFTITGLELLGSVSSLTLTDMNGKVVKVLDTKATKFSMSSIKPGVYFLNIISGNKQEVLKIVKE